MHTLTEGINKNKWFLIIVIISSTLLHLSIFLMGYTNPDSITVLDARFYIKPAELFLKTGTLLSDWNKPLVDRTPGYPLFIIFFLHFFKHPYLSLAITQILLHSIIILTLYKIASILFEKNIALLTAFLIGFDYVLMFYQFLIITESLYLIFLNLFFLSAILYIKNSPHQNYWSFLSGLFLSIATLIRPITYYLMFMIPFLMGYYLYIKQKYAYNVLLKDISLYLLPCMLLIGGWQIRNCQVAHDCKFSHLTDASFTRAYFPNNYNNYIEQQKKTGRNFNVTAFDFKDNIFMLINFPLLTIKEINLGIVKLFLAIPQTILTFFKQNGDIKKYNKIKQHILHQNINAAITSFFNTKFSLFTLIYYLFGYGINVLSYVIISAGLLFAKKNSMTSTKKQKFSQIFLWICALYFVAVSANYTAGSRLRVPIQSILDMYAAVGIVGFLKLISTMSFKKNDN